LEDFVFLGTDRGVRRKGGIGDWKRFEKVGGRLEGGYFFWRD